MKKYLRLGQCAKVINTGQTYTSYDNMAQLLGAKSWFAQGYDKSPYYGEIVKLKKKAYHGMAQPEKQKFGTMVYLCENHKGKEYLIGVKGLRCIPKLKYCNRCKIKIECVVEEKGDSVI